MEYKNRKQSGFIYIMVAVVFLFAGSFFTFALDDYVDDGVAFAAEPKASKAPTVNNSGAMANFYNPVVDVAEQCMPSVVGVINNERMLDYYGDIREAAVAQGSGVIISEDGYIITNNHVIEGGSSVQIILPGDDPSDAIDADVVGTDPITDIALLKVDRTGLPAAKLGDSDLTKVGELVVAIGTPLMAELSNTATVGYVSAVGRDSFSEEGEGYIQTDAAINPGNSGGGLFNVNGELIGMPSMKLSSDANMLLSGSASIEGLAFAIPVNQIKEITDQLRDGGEVERTEGPRLGVNIRNVRESDFGPAGVLVVGVEENSPAMEADLREWDIITSIDGERTEVSTDLQKALKKYAFGDTVELEVYRNKKAMTIEVELFEMEEIVAEFPGLPEGLSPDDFLPQE